MFPQPANLSHTLHVIPCEHQVCRQVGLPEQRITDRSNAARENQPKTARVMIDTVQLEWRELWTVPASDIA